MSVLSNEGFSPKSRMHVIRDMVIFVEVGRRENFTNAAKSLGIPLSTLARRISHLEEELGMLLVERTTRQQRLTPDGLKYFERCQHVVDDALAAYDDVHSLSHGLGGVVRVGIPLEILGPFMAEAIAAFLKQHDGVAVLVDMATSSAVPGPDCDLLVRIGKPEEQWLVASKAGAVPLSLYAAPSYLAANPQIQSRKDLKGHSFLLRQDIKRYCSALLRDVAPAKVNLNGRLACDTFQPVASFANLGHGITVLPAEIAKPFVASGGLVPVLPGWAPATLPIFLVVTSRLLPVRLRTFMLFLSKRFWNDFNPRQDLADDFPE